MADITNAMVNLLAKIDWDFENSLQIGSVPPVPNWFIAQIETAFIKEVFYIPQYEWKTHVKHNYKLDDLGAGFEIAEGY